MSSSISTLIVALFLTTQAFIINPSTRLHHPSIYITILYSQNKSENEEDIDNNDEDNVLLNELRQQAQQKLGADIPNTDEFKEAAKAAENDFLAAMLEESNKFKEIKSNEGSDKAVEVFMGEIQKSDEEAAAAMRRSDDERGDDSQVDVNSEEEEKDDIGNDDDWQ